MKSLAIWSFDKRVLYPLVILSLGHWAVILRGKSTSRTQSSLMSDMNMQTDDVAAHAIWFQPLETCAVDGAYDYWFAAMFVYSAYQISRSRSPSIECIQPTKFPLQIAMVIDTVSLVLALVGLVVRLPSNNPVSRALRREG